MALGLGSEAISSPSSFDNFKNSSGKEVYFFDWYKDYRHKTMLDKEIKKEGKYTPSWAAKGTATPFRKVRIHGETYVFGEVCQPHQCGNSLYVLIRPDSKSLVGAIILYPRDLEFFGNPTEDERDALEAIQAGRL